MFLKIRNCPRFTLSFKGPFLSPITTCQDSKHWKWHPNTTTGYIMAPKSGTYFLELLFWTRPFSTIIRDKTGNDFPFHLQRRSSCQGGSRWPIKTHLSLYKRLWRCKSTMSSRCRFIYLSTNGAVRYTPMNVPLTSPNSWVRCCKISVIHKWFSHFKWKCIELNWQYAIHSFGIKMNSKWINQRNNFWLFIFYFHLLDLYELHSAIGKIPPSCGWCAWCCCHPVRYRRLPSSTWC